MPYFLDQVKRFECSMFFFTFYWKCLTKFMYDFNEMCRSCFKLTVHRINAIMICHNFSPQHFMIFIYSKIHNDIKTNLGNGAGTVDTCGVVDLWSARRPPEILFTYAACYVILKLICPVFVRPFQIERRTVVFVVSFIVTVSYKDNALDDGSRRAMNLIVLYEYRWDVNKIKHNSNKRVGWGFDRELFKTGVWWHVGRFVICVRWFSTHLSP